MLFLFLTHKTLAGNFKLAIGGAGNDYGLHIIETSDKGFLVVGYTTGGTTATDDGLIIKLDKDGKILWSKIIANPGNERFYGCIEMNSNYFLVGNTTSSSNGGQDAWCVKLTTNGDVVWSKIFGGTSDDGLYKLAILPDNTLAMCGYSGGYGEQYAYLYLIRIDENGNTFYEKKYGNGLTSTQTNSARGLALTQAGNLILSGYTYCFGAGLHDAVVFSVKPSDGTRIWTKSFGGPLNDGFNSIHKTKDDHFICSGAARLDGSPNTKYWVVKLNAQGDTVWQKNYYQNPTYSYSGNIANAEDDGFIGLLNENSSSGLSACNVMRLNSFGNLLWAKRFDGINSEAFSTVLTTSDNSYVALGQTNSFGNGRYDIFLVKLDKNGEMDSCCVRTVNILNSKYKNSVISQTQDILQYSSISTYSNVSADFSMQVLSNCTDKIKPFIINDTFCTGINYPLPGGGSTNVSGTFVKNYTTLNGCDSSIILNLFSNKSPKTGLRDSVLCEYDFDTIKLKIANFMSYRWMPNGEITSNIIVTRPGYYSVTITDFDSCTYTDSVFIETNCTPQIFVPNAFTPNNDHLNDFFNASGVSLKQYNMLIFNRWGEKLFESNSIQTGWDGTYLGKECQQGVYLYIIYAIAIDFQSYFRKGTFTLLR